MAESDNRATWARVGSTAGYLAGACLLVQTLLYLADSLDLLDTSPEFHRTSAGRLQDIATFFAAYLNHEHRLAWDIGVRDSLGPLAYLALMVLAMSLALLIGSRRPEAVLMVLFFVVGGLLAALSDLTYLTLLHYFHSGGWSSSPEANVIAVGRSVESIDSLTTATQAAGFLVIAVALACLVLLSRREAGLSRWLTIAAGVEAVALVLFVVAIATGLSTLYDVSALLTGILLAPAVGILAGREVARLGPAAT